MTENAHFSGPKSARISAALAATHAASFPAERVWSAQEFNTLLAATGSILAGNARAFVLLRVVADEAEILTLATHPDHRRRGLAAAALAEATIRAADAGAYRLFLEVAADNAPALALYHRAGFTETGRRKRYYLRPDGAVDALILARDLSRS